MRAGHVHTKIIFFATAFCAIAVSAQEDRAVPYDGHWVATIQVPQGARYKSQITISDYRGDFRGALGKMSPSYKACKSDKFPITVHESNDTELQFSVWGRSVSPNCPDLMFVLKPVDATKHSFEGTVGSLGNVSLLKR